MPTITEYLETQLRDHFKLPEVIGQMKPLEETFQKIVDFCALLWGNAPSRCRFSPIFRLRALADGTRQQSRRGEGTAHLIVRHGTAGDESTILVSVAGIIAIKPEGDKKMRMSIASVVIEAGKLFLPKQASWLPDLEDELFSFPGGRHDDQCDSISQALNYGRKKPPMYISPEAFRRLTKP